MIESRAKFFLNENNKFFLNESRDINSAKPNTIE